MSDDNDKEVFMMMRYPVSMGALSESELDQLFGTIRKVNYISFMLQWLFCVAIY